MDPRPRTRTAVANARRRLVRSLVPVAAALLLLGTGCVPGVQQALAPRFVFVPEGSGLHRLDPPGVGEAAAVFRIQLRVENPNPVGLRLAGLDGDLYLNGRRAAAASFVGGVAVAANGSSPLPLEVRVPLAAAVPLLADLSGLVAGQPTLYRLDAAVAFDLFGGLQRLPSATLAEGTVTQPLRLALPEIALDPDRTGVAIGPLRSTVEVGLTLDNDGPLGYLLRTPALELRLGGRPLARAAVRETPVPAQGRGRLDLRFEIATLDLGGALVQQLQGGQAVEIALGGRLALELPGIAGEGFDVATVASGLLR